jgi:hypothetical protein
MSFREKSTWVTFVLLLVTFVIYVASFFVLYGPVTVNGQSVPAVVRLFGLFGIFIALMIGFVVIEVVMHVLLALRTPKDANAPLDEREKMIVLKSTQPAFYVLLVGAFLVIGTMHLGITTYHMAHSILFVVWAAELVRYGMQLYYFRRGV